MEKRVHLGRGAAIAACAASLAGGAAALAPAAASARAASSCGSKTISVAQKGGKTVTVPVSRISVEGGATCAEASTVIRGALVHKPPSGWVVREGHFKVPSGLTAEIATKGGKTVKYSLAGA